MPSTEVPYQYLSIESTLDPPSFSLDTTFNAQIIIPSGSNLLYFSYLEAGQCLECSTFGVHLQQKRGHKHLQFQHLCYFFNLIRRRHVYCAIDGQYGLKFF